METLEVWKDKEGTTIHIGKDWAHDIVPVYGVDVDGNVITDPETGEPINQGDEDQNPIPEGAYLTTATGEWVEGYWVDEADVYKAKRKAAYPPLHEQLDILGKEGVEGLAKVREAIKAKYPKPEDKPVKKAKGKAV